MAEAEFAAASVMFSHRDETPMKQFFMPSRLTSACASVASTESSCDAPAGVLAPQSLSLTPYRNVHFICWSTQQTFCTIRVPQRANCTVKQFAQDALKRFNRYFAVTSTSVKGIRTCGAFEVSLCHSDILDHVTTRSEAVALMTSIRDDAELHCVTQKTCCSAESSAAGHAMRSPSAAVATDEAAETNKFPNDSILSPSALAAQASNEVPEKPLKKGSQRIAKKESLRPVKRSAPFKSDSVVPQVLPFSTDDNVLSPELINAAIRMYALRASSARLRFERCKT